METKGLEIKCPAAHTQVKYLFGNKLPTEYILQVQGSMWVTGLDEWDFLSYHPSLPTLLLNVKKDEAIHKALDKYVPPFIKELNEKRRKIDEAVRYIGC